MKVAASWSGGKESCFACYKAICQGFDVSHLLNMVDEKMERSRSHGLGIDVIAAQAEAIGIPIIQRGVRWDTYEQGFKNAVNDLKKEGIEGMVFGDIDVQEHRDWTERICEEMGIKCFQPLWKMNRKELLREFLSLGFKAIIVSAKKDFFDDGWLGREIDRVLLDELDNVGIDLCGELGEYHTFVIDGPIFKKQVEVLESKTVTRDGRWFLDISNFIIKSKS